MEKLLAVKEFGLRITSKTDQNQNETQDMANIFSSQLNGGGDASEYVFSNGTTTIAESYVWSLCSFNGKSQYGHGQSEKK